MLCYGLDCIACRADYLKMQTASKNKRPEDLLNALGSDVHVAWTVVLVAQS